MPLQTEVLLQRRHLHEELLHTDVFTQTYSYMIPDGGHQFYAKEFSKQVQNQNFTTALDDLDALWQNHPNAKKRNFTPALTIETQSGYTKSHFR